MLRTLFTILFLSFFITVYAQPSEKVELKIGDSLVFKKCTGDGIYNAMDLITKTRFPNLGKTSYNKETGEGFYTYFFLDGDMDGQRLPCNYENKKCKIVSSQTLKDKSGKERLVVFGELKEGMQVVWIEIEMAFENGEISLQ